MKDTTSGAPLLLYLPEKSTSAYAVRSMCVWLKKLGYAKILLQHDPENACKSLAARIQTELGPEMIQLRESPPFSHQSLGAGEGSNSQMAGTIRRWLAALQKRYPEAVVDVNHATFPCLCKHVSAQWTRYHIQQSGVTAHLLLHGREYNSPMVCFCECVLAKLPNSHSLSKSKPRWFMGTFAGRLEKDDSCVILTAEGAVPVRSVRRLQAEDQFQLEVFEAAAGLPWAPRSGRRIKALTSQIQVVPIAISSVPAE